MAQIKTFLTSRKWYLIAIAAVILIAGGAYWSLSGTQTVAGAADSKPEVTVGRVADLMGGNSLSTIAEIRSASEAKISAEMGGRVIRVSASLGDRVGAGQVLAEVENGSQRAAVLQAEGALEATKAANVNTDISLDSAKSSAVNTLLNAYAAAESAIHDTIDSTFTNPESGGRKYRVLSTFSQDKMWLENFRSDLSTILKRQAFASATLTTNTDLPTELATTEAELRQIRAYLDTDIKVLNAGIPSPEISAPAISGYLAGATAARAVIMGALSSIVTAQSSLQVASNNSGGAGTVSSSGAALKQAQGAYNATLASLEKTIIRSPIAGTLNHFTIKLGDYLSPSQEVAVVSKNGALEAVAYVTEEDRSRISVGQNVVFENGTSGTIATIAPALDPVTRRIEVRISLSADAAKVLTNGSSVRVELGKADAQATVTTLSIPITALRMETNRTVVFIVVDGTLAAKEIKIGKLSGDFVQVTDGLTAETEIVADARGLKEGEEVVISK